MPARPERSAEPEAWPFTAGRKPIPFVRPAQRAASWSLGRFCCSMYCLMMVNISPGGFKDRVLHVTRLYVDIWCREEPWQKPVSGLRGGFPRGDVKHRLWTS